MADQAHAVRDKTRIATGEPLHQRLDCRKDLSTDHPIPERFARCLLDLFDLLQEVTEFGIRLT